MTDFAALRRTMVETQLRTNDVTDSRIQRAMLDVPREAFVPPARRASAYAEHCVELGKERVLADARSFAKLVQALEIEPNETVLDIGCGSGYSTAVLAQLAARVVGLECDADLLAAARANLSVASNVTLASGPLPEGWPSRAPYGAIILNGSVDFIPPAVLEQLAEGGRLGCFMRMRAGGQAVVHTRHDGAIGDRVVFDADLPLLPGFARRPSFVF